MEIYYKPLTLTFYRPFFLLHQSDFPNIQQEFLYVIDEIAELDYIYRVDEWYLPRMIEYINSTENAPIQLTEDNLIPPDQYIEAIDYWVSSDTIAKELMPIPYLIPELKSNETRRQYEVSVVLSLHKMNNVEDYMSFIKQSRAIMSKTGTTLNLENPEYTSLNLFGYGAVFTFYEQYLQLENEGYITALGALLAIYIVGICSLGLLPATVMVFMIIILIIELIGCLGWVGLKVSLNRNGFPVNDSISIMICKTF